MKFRPSLARKRPNRKQARRRALIFGRVAKTERGWSKLVETRVAPDAGSDRRESKTQRICENSLLSVAVLLWPEQSVVHFRGREHGRGVVLDARRFHLPPIECPASLLRHLLREFEARAVPGKPVGALLHAGFAGVE